MNLPSKKRWNPDRVILFQAIVIAIVFHLLLGLLFYVPAPERAGADQKTKQISMLSLNGNTPVLTGNISSWLEYGDPTVVLKSSPKDGIRLLLGERDLNTPEDDLSYFKTKDPHSIKKQSFQVKLDIDKNEFSGNTSFATAPPPRLSPGVLRRVKQAYPVWKNESGEILPLELSGLEKLISLRRPENATGLEVKFRDPDLLPNVKIVESSGSNELDNKAVSTFLEAYKTLNLNEENSTPLFFFIEWRDYGGD